MYLNWVNIASDDGLLANGIKPLPNQSWTKHVKCLTVMSSYMKYSQVPITLHIARSNNLPRDSCFAVGFFSVLIMSRFVTGIRASGH